MDEKEYLNLLSEMSSNIKKLEINADYLRCDLNEQELKLSMHKKTASAIFSKILKTQKYGKLSYSEEEYEKTKKELLSTEEEIKDLNNKFIKLKDEAKNKYPSLNEVFKCADARAEEFEATKIRILEIMQEGYDCLRKTDKIISLLDEDDFLELGLDSAQKEITDSPEIYINEIKSDLNTSLLKFRDDCLAALPADKKPAISEGFFEWISDNISKDIKNSDLIVQAAKTLQVKIIYMLECLTLYRSDIEKSIESILFY